MPKDLPNEPKDAPQKWFTIREAADYLRVSQTTIFRWMKDESLTYYKIGGSTRFSQECLNAIVEKMTGQKEAADAAERCASCGHSVLIEGGIQGAGKLHFKPEKSSFWVLAESMVPTRARVCQACGYIHLYADPDKLRKLKARPESETS